LGHKESEIEMSICLRNGNLVPLSQLWAFSKHSIHILSREDKKEKKPFWDNIIRDKDKEKDRDKEKEREKWKSKDKERDRKDEDSPEELTKMIGYLTATASEDWALVLEVCDRASATEAHAKEAVRALRKEFKSVSHSVFLLSLFVHLPVSFGMYC